MIRRYNKNKNPTIESYATYNSNKASDPSKVHEGHREKQNLPKHRLRTSPLSLFDKSPLSPTHTQNKTVVASHFVRRNGSYKVPLISSKSCCCTSYYGIARRLLQNVMIKFFSCHVPHTRSWKGKKERTIKRILPNGISTAPKMIYLGPYRIFALLFFSLCSLLATNLCDRRTNVLRAITFHVPFRFGTIKICPGLKSLL
ncbi:hypothetical protein CDAR_496511 [Caerostris darwini]|uniref:Uncharacterized protein n=1 Tax=Caerostris darwini TaxID=1538125 RepID=A0AAV4Q9Q8_9ARAC|nr:hypothetical protein CDAR_496511 [Caerostris darwini]